MSLSTRYTQDYQQAVSDYMKGHYQEAAETTDQLVKEYPDDPNLRLLRGHIYSCLQKYEIANQQYKSVLELTHDPELLDCARNSLADSTRYLESGFGYSESMPSIENNSATLTMTNGNESQLGEAVVAQPTSSLQTTSDGESSTADENPFAVNSNPFDDYVSAPLVSGNTNRQPLVSDSFADGEDDTLLMNKNHSTSDSESSDTRPSGIFSDSESDAIQSEFTDISGVDNTIQSSDADAWDEPFDLAGENTPQSADLEFSDSIDQTEFPMSGIDLSAELSMDGLEGNADIDTFDPATEFDLDPSLLNLAEDEQDLIGDTGLINVAENAQAVAIDDLPPSSDLAASSQSGFLGDSQDGSAFFSDSQGAALAKKPEEC